MSVNPQGIDSLESKETFELFQIVESHLEVYENKIEAMKEARAKAETKRNMKNKNNRFKK